MQNLLQQIVQTGLAFKTSGRLGYNGQTFRLKQLKLKPKM